jgi:hypothetical protein
MVGESGREWGNQIPPKGLSPMQSSPDILTKSSFLVIIVIHRGKSFPHGDPARQNVSMWITLFLYVPSVYLST